MLNEKSIEALLTRKLVSEGYSVKINATVYKNYIADIIAEKDEEKNYIEIKTNKETLINGLINAKQLMCLPKISDVYFAIPSDEASDSIIKMSEIAGIGIYSVSSASIELKVKPRKLYQGTLMGGGSFPSSVVAGNIFDIRLNYTARERIFSNVKIALMIGDPFFIPQGEVTSKSIDHVLPEESININFRVGANKDASPGKYSLFFEIISEGSPLIINNFQIEIVRKSKETVLQEVNNSISLLNQAITANLTDILNQIDDAIFKEIIDIHDNVKEKSIWALIGNFCIDNGLFRQAEVVYKRMSDSIRKCEEKYGERLHKGMALYNLGIALYYQGKLNEAKMFFEKAYQEDKQTFGETEAEKLDAKKAILELFKEA